MEAGPGEGQGCPGYFPSPWTGRRSLASRCAELRTWLAAERRAACLSAAPPGERRKRAHSLSRERSLLPFNSFPNTEVPPREVSVCLPQGQAGLVPVPHPLPQGRLPQPSGSTLHSLRADPKTHRGCDTALPVKSRAAAPGSCIYSISGIGPDPAGSPASQAVAATLLSWDQCKDQVRSEDGGTGGWEAPRDTAELFKAACLQPCVTPDKKCPRAPATSCVVDTPRGWKGAP